MFGIKKEKKKSFIIEIMWESGRTERIYLSENIYKKFHESFNNKTENTFTGTISFPYDNSIKILNCAKMEKIELLILE